MPDLFAFPKFSMLHGCQEKMSSMLLQLLRSPARLQNPNGFSRISLQREVKRIRFNGEVVLFLLMLVHIYCFVRVWRYLSCTISDYQNTHWLENFMKLRDADLGILRLRKMWIGQCWLVLCQCSWWEIYSKVWQISVPTFDLTKFTHAICSRKHYFDHNDLVHVYL